MNRRSGARSRFAATAVFAAVATAAALVSGASAAQAATPTTVVRGTVTVGGVALAGVAVGTWSPTHGLQAETTTDAHGAFVLRTPSGVAVDAFAGAKPSLSHAVFAAGSRQLVRGVIGAAVPKRTPSALYQMVTEVLPGQLGGGHALRFRLQEAGRFTSAVPTGGTGRIALERGDGQYGSWTTAVDGTITSRWLVPGRYHVYWDPKLGYLPTRTWVTVAAGTTPTAATLPVIPRGTDVTLHVTSGGRAVPAGVPIVLDGPDGQTAAPSTDATGSSTLTGVAPGTYRFTVGEYYDDPDEGLEGPPTSDDYLTATTTVTVAAGQATTGADVTLTPASKLTGTATVARNHTVTVVVENGAGEVVRAGSANGTAGTIALGGMPAGTYTVFAQDMETHTYDSVRVTLPAPSTAADAATPLPRTLTPSRPLPTLSGTVSGGARGAVLLRARTETGFARPWTTFGTSGRYTIHVLPGRYVPWIDEDGHRSRTTEAITITGSKRLDLTPGAKLAGARARIVVHGHPVAVDLEVHGPRRPIDTVVPSYTDTEVVQHTTTKGVVAVADVVAGHYTWLRALTSLPAADGPWHYGVPTGSFTLHAGRTLDLGTRSITIAG